MSRHTRSIWYMHRLVSWPPLFLFFNWCNTWEQKRREKRGRPGNTYHVTWHEWGRCRGGCTIMLGDIPVFLVICGIDLNQYSRLLFRRCTGVPVYSMRARNHEFIMRMCSCSLHVNSVIRWRWPSYTSAHLPYQKHPETSCKITLFYNFLYPHLLELCAFTMTAPNTPPSLTPSFLLRPLKM